MQYTQNLKIIVQKMKNKMKKLPKILSIILLITILYLSIIVICNVSSAEGEISEFGSWKYDDKIRFQFKYLFNNVWGAGNEEKSSGTLKSYIYYKQDGSFGWEWSRPEPIPNPTVLPIVPVVMVKNFVINNKSYFPKLKDISYLKLDVDYKYVKPPNGSYNLAYDIWFVTSGKDRSDEIMIWINCPGTCSPGTYRGEFSDGYNVYDLYTRPTAGGGYPWAYYAFILKDRYPIPQTHTVNVKALFDKLVQLGYLSPELSLYSIDLGNEVWKGSGRIEISRYIININRVSIDMTKDIIPISPGIDTSPTISPIPTQNNPNPIIDPDPQRVQNPLIRVICYVIKKTGNIIPCKSQ